MNTAAGKTGRRMRAAVFVAAFVLALCGLLFLLREPLLHAGSNALHVQTMDLHKAAQLS